MQHREIRENNEINNQNIDTVKNYKSVVRNNSRNKRILVPVIGIIKLKKS
jgi:hypothetical protein